MEILVLPLGAMAALSVAGVFAAFVSRTAAKACVVPSIGLAVLFLLVVLSLNDWSPRGFLRAVHEVPYPFAMVAGSLILSAVAIRAPLRRPDAVLPDGRTVRGRPRWGLLALAAGVTAAGVGFGVDRWVDGRRGEEKTRALLAGDQTVRLQRVRVNHQQRRLDCTDPEVLRYLEGRLRGHGPVPDHAGVSYELTLSYEGGGTGSFSSYWDKAGDFELFLGEPGEGGTGHGIRLPRPRPRGGDELVSFLSKASAEAAGQVLIQEAGGSRVERDTSLIAR